MDDVLGRIDGDASQMTVVAWRNKTKYKGEMSESTMGKLATKAYRERFNEEPEKVGSTKWNTVNIYPVWFLNEVLTEQ